jgi:hypothetical protein
MTDNFRVFKVTFYALAAGDTKEVFQEEVERSLFRNREKLIEPPCVLSINRVSAVEVPKEEFLRS